MFTQNFFPHSLQKLPFSKKLLNEKNIQNLISKKKKRLCHFRWQAPPSLQKRLGPQKQFLLFSQKIQLFFLNC